MKNSAKSSLWPMITKAGNRETVKKQRRQEMYHGLLAD